MERLEIRLLGGFQLGRDGRILEQLPLRAARSLFAFLVLNRERPHTRDLLAGTFWPEFDESRARRRLSQALWQTQATLGEEDEQLIEAGPCRPTVASATAVTQHMHTVTVHQWKLY